jgi:hypothetical protein
MNLKSLMTGAAIAATVVGGSVAVSAPAEALIIGGASSFTPVSGLPATLNVTGEFSNGDLTGGFTSVTGIQVGTLNITAPGNYGATPSYITNFVYQGQNAVFNLLSGSGVYISNSGLTFFGDDIFGEIRTLGGTLLATATGSLSGSQTSRSSDFSLSLKATAVPTPALLPGLVGMGVAALRKRKGEGTEVEKETVGVKA